MEWDRAAGVSEQGTILVLEPSERLSYTWEALSPTPTTITFVLRAENSGTRLQLIQTGIGVGADWDAYHTALTSGWTKHLHNLRAWLETGSCAAPGPTGTLTPAATA